jgi:hypothetical protein
MDHLGISTKLWGVRRGGACEHAPYDSPLATHTSELKDDAKERAALAAHLCDEIAQLEHRAQNLKQQCTPRVGCNPRLDCTVFAHA